MKVTAATRSRARHYAMQAIYQWQMTGNTLNTIEAEFHADNNMDKVDVEYFHALFHGVAKIKSELDELYAPFCTSLSAEELDPVTQSILRLSTFEMKERIDVPYKVVINEAVNLAKKFSAADSHKFVNGVMDKTAAKLREVEVTAAKNAPPRKKPAAARTKDSKDDKKIS